MSPSQKSTIYQAILVILSSDPYWVPNGHGLGRTMRSKPIPRLSALLAVNRAGRHAFDQVMFDRDTPKTEARAALLSMATLKPEALEPYTRYVTSFEDGCFVTDLFVASLNDTVWRQQIGNIVGAQRAHDVSLATSVPTCQLLAERITECSARRTLEAAERFVLYPRAWRRIQTIREKAGRRK